MAKCLGRYLKAIAANMPAEQLDFSHAVGTSNVGTMPIIANHSVLSAFIITPNTNTLAMDVEVAAPTISQQKGKPTKRPHPSPLILRLKALMHWATA
jgi:hypothetical protein